MNLNFLKRALLLFLTFEKILSRLLSKFVATEQILQDQKGDQLREIEPGLLALYSLNLVKKTQEIRPFVF